MNSSFSELSLLKSKLHLKSRSFLPESALKIEFFEKDGKDMTVTASEAMFDLANTLLSTETTTTIKREDFLMVGDSATFDTTKRFGTMKGHVHTDIRNGTPQN